MLRYALKISFLILVAVAVAGCSGEEEPKDKDKTPANPAEAFTNYLGDTIQKKEESRNQLGMTQARQRIRNFWSANGRYPKDLNELQSSTGPLPRPGRGYKYQYNPANGNITTVKAR